MVGRPEGPSERPGERRRRLWLASNRNTKGEAAPKHGQTEPDASPGLKRHHRSSSMSLGDASES